MTSDDIRLSPIRIMRDQGVSQEGTMARATACETTAVIVPARGTELSEDGKGADLGTDVIVTATATGTTGEIGIGRGTDEAPGRESGAPAETDIMIGEVRTTFHMRMSPDYV